MKCFQVKYTMDGESGEDYLFAKDLLAARFTAECLIVSGAQILGVTEHIGPLPEDYGDEDE